jgi:hypothetical protein
MCEDPESLFAPDLSYEYQIAVAAAVIEDGLYWPDSGLRYSAKRLNHEVLRHVFPDTTAGDAHAVIRFMKRQQVFRGDESVDHAVGASLLRSMRRVLLCDILGGATV